MVDGGVGNDICLRGSYDMIVEGYEGAEGRELRTGMLEWDGAC